MKLCHLVVGCALAACALAGGPCAGACPLVAVPASLRHDADVVLAVPLNVLLSAVETTPVEIASSSHFVLRGTRVRTLAARRARLVVRLPRSLRVVDARRGACR